MTKDMKLGPLRLYVGAQPGIGHEGSAREVEVRLALVLGRRVAKAAFVLAEERGVTPKPNEASNRRLFRRVKGGSVFEPPRYARRESHFPS